MSNVRPHQMRRAAIEKHRTLRIWRAHLATHKQPVVCSCDLQPGRFRKSQRIGGCGRTRCWLCHGEKLAGRPTQGDVRAIARYREGLIEVRLTGNSKQTRHGAVQLRR